MLGAPRYLAGLARRGARGGALAAAAVAAAALAPALAGAATSAVAIAELNAQRAANGIPAGLTENPALSAACAAHDAYMAENRLLTHVEDPGKPGYTQGGAYVAQNAVLTQGTGWDTGDPYDDAPLHLDQLLAPRLQSLGSADTAGFSCTTTFPGWTRPAPATTAVFTYPGPGAVAPPSELARELPYTPGQLIGIAAGAVTGPYLVVLVDAPGQSPLDNPAILSGATLTGPAGPVAVETVDGTASLAGATGMLAAYISPGGFVIPLAPLQPNSTYRAHVVVGFGGIATVHDWAFTTTGEDPQSRLTAGGGRLRFSSRSRGRVRVTFTSPAGARAAPLTLAPGQSKPLRLTPGSWQACGVQPADGGYAGSTQCLSLVVTGRPVLSLGRARLAAGRLRIPLRFSPVLRGRTATLTVITPARRCPAASCRARSVTTTFALRRSQLSLPAPAAGRRVLVRLSTDAFVLGAAPWAAAGVTTSYRRPR